MPLEKRLYALFFVYIFFASFEINLFQSLCRYKKQPLKQEIILAIAYSTRNLNPIVIDIKSWYKTLAIINKKNL